MCAEHSSRPAGHLWVPRPAIGESPSVEPHAYGCITPSAADHGPLCCVVANAC